MKCVVAAPPLRLALVLGLTVLAGGCGDELAPLPHTLSSGRANSDHEVFDVVLADLIDNQEFDPAVGGRSVKKSEIVLSGTTRKGLGRSLLNHPPCDLPKEIPSEAWADLFQRNPQGKRYSLAHYRPSNPNILVRTLSADDRDFLKFGERFPDARGYVESYLPAYSPDGQTALLYFTFGPTEHGAVGSYLLSRVNGRWEMTWRLIGYFL